MTNTGRRETFVDRLKFFLFMATHAILFAIFLIGGMAIIAVGFTVAFIRQDMDYKRRKKKYEEERTRAREQFRAEVDAILARSVAQQKTDQPAVTLPITNAERQERRRVLKLYT